MGTLVEAAGKLAGAYLLGGIPFSLLLGYAAKGVDIRAHGSGNVGATNVGRVCGWGWFPAAFGLDFAKGLLPVLVLAPEAHPSDTTEIALRVSLAAAPVLGHVFSPFLRFRGGKGVATAAGALSALVPVETGIAFCVWVLILAVTKQVGVASSAAAAALPVAFFLTERRITAESISVGILLVLLSALVIVRHRSNLKEYFGPPDPTDR